MDADFQTTIRAISPDYALFQDTGWQYVPEIEDVPGDRIRLFALDWGFGEPVEDGIFGQGVEHEFELRVWANYRSLNGLTTAEIVERDGRQLWLALEQRLDPTVSGLVFVQPAGPFEAENDEPRDVWGFYPFVVTMLLDHAP